MEFVKKLPAGKYYAYYGTFQFQNHYSSKGGEPFAILLNEDEIWDLNAFRPDLLELIDNEDQQEKNPIFDVLILYETINCSTGVCYQMPRYLFVENKGWFTNVR